MARGWESKSVESQVDDRQRERDRSNVRLDPDGIERDAKRQTLELSLTRIRRELLAARTAAHQQALEKALEHLEKELRALEPSPSAD